MVEEVTVPAEAPTSAARVIGQDRAKRIWSRTLRGDRLGHSYLFVGSPGTGRLALALESAAFLNCPRARAPFEDCNCPSCRQVWRLVHPNLFLVFPLPMTKDEARRLKAREDFLRAKAEDPYAPLPLDASKSGQILIDEVRAVRSALSLAQDRPGTRVVVILPAEQMNEEAANALLKHLEEPPERCLWLLLTENPGALLPTIASRCQTLRLALLSERDIAAALQARRGVPAEEARIAAALAGGSYTRALSIAGGTARALLDEALRFLRACARGDAFTLAQIAERWSQNLSRLETSSQLEYVALWLQDALRRKSDFTPAEEAVARMSPDFSEVVGKMAQRYPHHDLAAALGEVEESRLALTANVNTPLELVALGLKLHRHLKV